MKIQINPMRCIACGRCVRVCPAFVFEAKAPTAQPEALHPEMCIGCGHCVSICPVNAIEHAAFPPERVHPVDAGKQPTAEQLMHLLRTRRSHRNFSDAPVARATLEQLVDAAHYAPTASNQQEIGVMIIDAPDQLQYIIDFTLQTFERVEQLVKIPMLGALITARHPDAKRIAMFVKKIRALRSEKRDLILRQAKAVLFFYAPENARFGTEDANLAYQNASLLAHCLDLGHFYTGFVLAATRRAPGTLERALHIPGTLRAGMAIGMPDFHYPRYPDRPTLPTV